MKMSILFYMHFSSRNVALEWTSDKEHDWDWILLTLIYVGLLGVRFKVGGGGGGRGWVKLPPLSKTF